MTTRPNWETRILGNTNFEVTVMGIGGAWLGHSTERGVDEKIGIETVLRGLESGMNFVDTSGMYMKGQSEVIIGKALDEWFARGNKREDLIISTKTGTRVKPRNYGYDFTMESVETSLQALGVDSVELLLVHDPESLDPVFAENGALAALKRLKEEGVIGAIGLGCRRHEHHIQCIETGDFEVVLTHHDFNLANSSAYDTVIETARGYGVGVVNGSIMFNGYLGGADPDALRERAGKHGSVDEDVINRVRMLWKWCMDREIDLGTLNLQYCLREPKIGSTVIGFSRPDRVDQNVEAYLASFDEEVWEELYRDFDFVSPNRSR